MHKPPFGQLLWKMNSRFKESLESVVRRFQVLADDFDQNRKEMDALFARLDEIGIAIDRAEASLCS